MRQLFFLSVLFLMFSGCSKSDAESHDVAVSAVMVPPPPAGASESNRKDQDLTESSTTKIPQKIIKQGSLRFETDNLENTYNQIQKAVSDNKARVINDSEGKDYNSVYRSLTIKVPSQNFDRFINNVSKGVSYFEVKNISAEDVTEQFIDLTSRLNTKKKLEERYLQILQKATKVSEILEIEKQISAIREEIESKEGQLKYLESRVSESTVTIDFYKKTPEKEGIKISYGSKIWNAIKSGFFSLSDFLISLISVWPFVILFCVFAYFIRRRLKRRKKE
ncbi:DUF4349 domain-containing protein [Flavobacterium nitrogenifigens]|uniref:DUF4349 domain-containing protein n=1 Tax=Flavobacterium nitrogenifigens TaxID=1617283 RepID=A0A521CVV1_9FLAO|nr:DUF4349 domain-containing protein [Flavobacterium nitrogenifigens]KAF2332176.1 DUF4349 domain-containing protein [Flavobacterium nitrogenifigens]SMO63542.1 protein of unknown function [Flavobacterium nitrogenifigens]